MTACLLAPDRHSDRIMSVVHQGLREHTSELVANSWMRCVNDHQLDPDRPPSPPVLRGAVMEARRERMSDVIECARFEMTTLYQQLADPYSAVVLTDADGVILHLVSSPEFASELEPVGFTVGALWNEAEAGTNGMGTCLAAAEPVSVRQDDHFFTRFISLTCSAVPVYDPAGRMVGVLDVTSRSPLMQQHVLVLLGMTARMIENRLMDQRYRNAHPLHFHTRPELVYTLHEGRLALDDDGSILAANRSALFQLGASSLEEVRHRRIEEIFQTTLEDMLERSSTSSFHPVVTYRVNGAHRFFAVARRPAAEAGARAADTRRLPGRAPVPRSVSAPAGTTPDKTADPRVAAHLETARRVIARGTPVLLRGETGVGKEVFARMLHERSPHAGGAFVAVNCASLPENLIEAELFGYRAGAFTGAQRTGRRGKILQADGGTLFLDEIGDMPLDLQARLLRVLDERRVTPLGTEETQPVDFQLVSASHRNLAELVSEGRFREDLYYRLNGIELHLPSLRERADRRELIQQILHEEAAGDARLTPEAEHLLMSHPWPGNVRQLRHVLRTAVALADGRVVDGEHFPSLQAVPAAQALPTGPCAETPPAAPQPGPEGLNIIQASERQVLLRLLEQHRWNVSNVAKALDVSRNTLYRKLHKLQIPVSQRC
ncbi:MAG TPA: sigma-54-dependent Fis family transcriptional regulator [Burkholderiaceae bacterium]|nr:sigma-54-dependent Fis family transcriptional regulator [Burkholderiaceae bacterium]